MMGAVIDAFGRKLVESKEGLQVPAREMKEEYYLGVDSSPEEFAVREFLEMDILDNDVLKFEKIK